MDGSDRLGFRAGSGDAAADSEDRFGLRRGVPRVTQVLILERNPCARDGLCAILATYPDIAVLAAVADEDRAVDLALRMRPDVVVLDAGRSEAGGIGVARQVKSRHAGPRVVVLSVCSAYRHAALRAGADAFLLKGCPVEDLVDAIVPGRANASPRPAGA